MATNLVTQTINDGYRNTILKIDGYVNAADLTGSTVVDPSLLGQIDAQGTLSKIVRVKRINFDIEDGLECDLIWDGATPQSLWRCTGRGEIKGKLFGGFPNNATTPNGKITLTTEGGALATTNLAFTIVLEVVKAN